MWPAQLFWYIVVPKDILCFKLSVIDGMGVGKEVDNKDFMPKKLKNRFLSGMATSCAQWNSYQSQLLQFIRIKREILGDLHR